MIKRIALILAAVLLAGPTWAQEFLSEHLVPERSVIGGSGYDAEYESMVAATFKKAY